MNKLKVFIFSILLLTLLSNSYAITDLMGMQMTFDNSSISGDVNISIYDASSGGNLIYEEIFVDNITDGEVDIMLGINQNLLLDYGKNYYLDITANGSDLDFDNNERQQFQASIGNITNAKISPDNITSDLLDDNLTISDSLSIDYIYPDSSGNIYLMGGNVGIGTTSPTHALNVIGSINATGDVYVNSSSLWIGTQKISNVDGVLQWGSNQIGTGWNISGTNIFPGTLTNYIGIGTSTPSMILDVRGDGNFSGTLYINNATDLSTMATSTQLNASYGLNITFNQYVDWISGNNTYVRLDDINNSYALNSSLEDNFGTYNYNMTTGAETYADEIVITSTQLNTSYGLNITFNQYVDWISGNNTYVKEDSINNSYLLKTGDTASGDYTFDTSENTLHIDSTNHYVGIRTNTPSNALEVDGDANISGSLWIGGVNLTAAGANVSGGGSAGKIVKFTDTEVIGNSIIFETSDKIGIGTWAPTSKLHVYNGDVNFSDDTTQGFFYQDTTHRVGIGVSSPTHALNVVGGVNITGTLYAGNLEVNKWLYNMSDGSYNATYATWAYNQSTGYIPYTGANQNIVLGNNNFSVGGTDLFVNNHLARFLLQTQKYINPFTPLVGGSSHNGDIGIYYTVDENVHFGSAQVYSYGNGDVEFQLRKGHSNSGELVISKTFTVSSGWNTLYFDWSMTADIGDWTIYRPATGPGLFRASSGISYPQDYGTFHIVGNSYSSSYYYWFYHMLISGNNVDGNVGIGTTSPSSKLHVHEGDVNFSSGTAQGFFYDNGTGRVGIGTSSPANLLHVKKSGSAEGIGTFESDNDVSMKIKSTFSASDGAGIYLEFDDAYNSATDAWQVGVPISSTDFSIGFGTQDDFRNTDALFTIQNTTGNVYIKGNVGIGTTSPTHTLNVLGTMNVTKNALFEQNISMYDSQRICMSTDCTAFMCYNGSDILISNNEAGVSC